MSSSDTLMFLILLVAFFEVGVAADMNCDGVCCDDGGSGGSVKGGFGCAGCGMFSICA